ncbi:sodium/potassium/calcium exchanger 3-like protein [Camelus ferus]|nr:sodium/potassium/calcium exchanger 3-like protein [Camelus ferus]
MSSLVHFILFRRRSANTKPNKENTSVPPQQRKKALWLFPPGACCGIRFTTRYPWSRLSWVARGSSRRSRCVEAAVLSSGCFDHPGPKPGALRSEPGLALVTGLHEPALLFSLPSAIVTLTAFLAVASLRPVVDLHGYNKMICKTENIYSPLVLVLMYLVYIVIMKYNACMHQCFERRTKGAGNMVNGLASNAEVDDSSNCDATVVLLKRANFHRKASVIMVDELLSAYPHQLSFSEAGLRIMITSHFPPKTRLSMASRMLINERQRLINSRAYANGESEVAIRIPIKHTVENGTGPGSAPDRGGSRARRDDAVAEAGDEAENENEDNENNENDEDEEDEEDEEGPYTPFDPPSGKLETVKWAFTWPLSFVLYFTVPNCNKPRWEKWFMVTFASSTLWIAAFSYIMVWMVTVIGYTLGIPDVIMGITFLAAGTSVPDCMASLMGPRGGREGTGPRMGDMAVSNSIGSNVFDILIGLGLPWALQTLAVDYGSYIRLNSRGLIYSVGLLLASVFVTIAAGRRTEKRASIVGYRLLIVLDALYVMGPSERQLQSNIVLSNHLQHEPCFWKPAKEEATDLIPQNTSKPHPPSQETAEEGKHETSVTRSTAPAHSLAVMEASGIFLLCWEELQGPSSSQIFIPQRREPSFLPIVAQTRPGTGRWHLSFRQFKWTQRLVKTFNG